MKIVVSYNKDGYEGPCWEKEIRAISSARLSLIPFNHSKFLAPGAYENSFLLDRAYQSRDSRLLAMYAALRQLLAETRADVLFVTNAPPYHPDYLRTVPVYKVLYSTDDPGATYKRTIPYLHAYDHIMHCAIGYSGDMNLKEKLSYCGVKTINWLPLGVMNYECDADVSEEALFAQRRDIDVVYIGSWWPQKCDLLFRLKRALGYRLKVFGNFRIRHNLYINAHYRTASWVRRVSFPERVKLYQRAKIGINLHYNEYGLGNQRLYHLPANGAMQISDCGPILDNIFRVGSEIESYASFDELVDKIRYYLAHDAEREMMARLAYRRVMSQYRFATVMQRAAEFIEDGMRRRKWHDANTIATALA